MFLKNRHDYENTTNLLLDSTTDQLEDGAHFKFKKTFPQNNKAINKKLQVFTQSLNFGKQKMMMVTIKDVSLWIELEKEKNISSMKTESFASASHEFRNPLNGIISSLDMLVERGHI